MTNSSQTDSQTPWCSLALVLVAAGLMGRCAFACAESDLERGATTAIIQAAPMAASPKQFAPDCMRAAQTACRGQPLKRWTCVERMCAE